MKNDIFKLSNEDFRRWAEKHTLILNKKTFSTSERWTVLTVVLALQVPVKVIENSLWQKKFGWIKTRCPFCHRIIGLDEQRYNNCKRCLSSI